MYGVNSGVNFPNSYGYGKNTQAQGPFEQRSTPETKTSGRTDEILFSATYRKGNNAVSSLSDEAKNLLAELREKYKGYDFMVADYETDEEASRLLSQGKGEYNVLITPELLEKMASDKNEREKYESIIAGAADQFGEIENKLTEGGKSILEKLGFTVDADGNVDFYATLTGGAKTEGGERSVKASLVSELADMVNKLAESRAKAAENKHDVSETQKTDAEIAEAHRLSDGARDVLYELMEKYQGYDFIVGNWKTDEEASRVLSYGRGRDGNVLISPELLEEMAADESVKAKYIGIIDEAAGNLDKVKDELTQDGKSVVEKLGLTIGADGTVSYFAKLVDGVTADDGGSYIKCSIIEDFTKSLEALAKTRQKILENKDETEQIKLDTPEEKEEKVEKSVMPPKSFEKYEKEKKPYSAEEDYGTLPPESFKKYQTEADAEVAGEVMNYSV